MQRFDFYYFSFVFLLGLLIMGETFFFEFVPANSKTWFNLLIGFIICCVSGIKIYLLFKDKKAGRKHE